MNAYSILFALSVLGSSVLCPAQSFVTKNETPEVRNSQLPRGSANSSLGKLPKELQEFASGKGPLPTQIMKGKLLQTMGGADAGGGDAATDSKGHRRLMDLIESDDVDYFVPHIDYGANKTITSGMGSLIGTAQFCNHSSDKSNCQVLFQLGNLRFIRAMAMAYGLNLRAPVQEEKYYYCPIPIEYLLVDSKHERLCFWRASSKLLDLEANNLKYDIEKGYLPEIEPLRWAFTDQDLTEVHDEGVIKIDNPNSKKQLAVQKDGLVVISRPEFEKLDPVSQNALFVHESALYAVKKLNPQLLVDQGTAPVRAYVRALVKYFSDSKNYPSSAVKEAFDALKITDAPILW